MAEKAKIIPLEGGGGPIEVMFNPNEYTLSFEATYTGEDSKKQFLKTEVPDFTVTLFYDTYEKGTDVRKETLKVTSLLYPTVRGAKTMQPPTCLFIWGGFTYRGILKKITQKYTMFLPTGVPVRSILDITFETKELEMKVEEDKGLQACRKLWTVKSGDRLDLIANQALRDPTQWRQIAKLNKIANPFSFPSKNDFGRTLVIPDL